MLSTASTLLGLVCVYVGGAAVLTCAHWAADHYYTRPA